ncbi:MAG: hypothetical protein EOO42_01770 [Flavobacteriales bacterium]|nr:MAG: hypothetical protein EOO42_01770 [Flavobacteriales bacterium]
MTPEQFSIAWKQKQDNLVPLDKEWLITLGLKPSTIEFLALSGLPNSAAPFLSFVKGSGNEYDCVSLLTKQYDFLEEEFDKYVYIGSCSDGNPIVINTAEGDRIEELDHEDYFSPYNVFNTSINELAECLLCYRNFVARVIRENGGDAVIESNFTDEQIETLKQQLVAADSTSMADGSFWKYQLEMELAMREANR